MKNEAISYLTRALQLVIAAVAICVGILFVSKRIEAVEPAHGDIAVWITVHEFLKRGHSLYRDVWDHKDPGFFTWSHPFFETWGTEGALYVWFLNHHTFWRWHFLRNKKINREDGCNSHSRSCNHHILLPNFILLSLY